MSMTKGYLEKFAKHYGMDPNEMSEKWESYKNAMQWETGTSDLAVKLEESRFRVWSYRLAEKMGMTGQGPSGVDKTNPASIGF
jgi:hypothetical protein